MFLFSGPEAYGTLCPQSVTKPALEGKVLTTGQPRKPQLSENGTDKMICGEILNQHQELLQFSSVQFSLSVVSDSL